MPKGGGVKYFLLEVDALSLPSEDELSSLLRYTSIGELAEKDYILELVKAPPLKKSKGPGPPSMKAEAVSLYKSVEPRPNLGMPRTGYLIVRVASESTVDTEESLSHKFVDISQEDFNRLKGML